LYPHCAPTNVYFLVHFFALEETFLAGLLRSGIQLLPRNLRGNLRYSLRLLPGKTTAQKATRTEMI
jgi:hypothetical protein